MDVYPTSGRSLQNLISKVFIFIRKTYGNPNTLSTLFPFLDFRVNFLQARYYCEGVTARKIGEKPGLNGMADENTIIE